MHSVYVEDVGLSSPLTAEVYFFDSVFSARFSVGRKKPKLPKATAAAPIDPYLPACKAEADELGWRLKNQASLHVFYAS